MEEKKKLQTEREELAKKAETVDKRLRAKEAELILEAKKELSKQKAELDKQLNTHKEAQERSMEKQEKELADKLTNLEASNTKGLDTINELKAQIEEQCRLLITEAGRYEDLEKAKGVYKKEKEQLAEQLDRGLSSKEAPF